MSELTATGLTRGSTWWHGPAHRFMQSLLGRLSGFQHSNGHYGCCVLQSFRWYDLKVYYAFFAHLSVAYVREGDDVRPHMHGIARTGVSGMPAATHPHLHFEIRRVPDRHLTGMVGRIDPLIS